MDDKTIDFILDIKNELGKLSLEFNTFMINANNTNNELKHYIRTLQIKVDNLENRMKTKTENFEDSFDKVYEKIDSITHQDTLFTRFTKKLGSFFKSIFITSFSDSIVNVLKILFLIILATMIFVVFGDYQIAQSIKNTLEILK